MTHNAKAIAERVNGILKQEFLLENYQTNIKTMKLLVDDAVRIYNTQRPHWFCFMKTPEQMHSQSDMKIRTYKKPTRLFKKGGLFFFVIKQHG